MNYKTAIRRQKRNKKALKKILKGFRSFDLETTALKAVAVALIFALSPWSGGISVTKAFYGDNEMSENNLFRAGGLDFAVYDQDFSTREISLSFGTGTALSKKIEVELESESNPIKYQASTTDITGDKDFCDAINLSADLNGENQFAGSLPNFLSSATTTIGLWQYSFSLPSGSHFYNKICSFNFEYNGRQTLPHNEYESGGYYDIEKATSTIFSQGFRINKVYYDVASDRGTDPANEWVEIYNQTDQVLDIGGWQICDNNKCDILSSTSPVMIPAKGFAVITASSTTWNYWEIASNVVPILLSDSRIGDGLANSADMLVLKRSDGFIVDQMNWGTPNKESWDNYNDNVWDPGTAVVGDGHTLARRPNGFDTNQPSDFVDLAPPQLSLIYPALGGSQTWYWTYNYNIKWSAINLNGPDSDLSIDLSYIKDLDGTETITSSDEIISIAKNLPNTGIFNWTVPSGFLGYIWIKIAAFGAENPMLNARVASGKIWDPYPLELVFTDLETVLEAITDSMTATSTGDVLDSSQATTTPEVLPEETSSSQDCLGATVVETAIEEITPKDDFLATTTPEILGEGATTTPEIILEETLPVDLEQASTTSEVIGVTQSEPIIISPEPEPESTTIPESTPEPAIITPQPSPETATGEVETPPTNEQIL